MLELSPQRLHLIAMVFLVLSNAVREGVTIIAFWSRLEPPCDVRDYNYKKLQHLNGKLYILKNPETKQRIDTPSNPVLEYSLYFGNVVDLG